MIWKDIFSFLMCMHNIYTVFGVSLAVLGWHSKIDSGSKVFIVFLKCMNAVEQMFRTAWNIPCSPSHHPFHTEPSGRDCEQDEQPSR